MRGFDALMARAQELLDARLDPFDDQAFCEALAEDVDALEQVTQLRAVHLELSAARESRQPQKRPAILRWSWVALPAAAALLLWMTSERAPNMEAQPVTPTAFQKTELQESLPAAPAILKVREEVRTTAVQHRPKGDLLRVRITTTEQTKQI